MDFDITERRRSGRIIQKKTPLSKQIKKSLSMLTFTLIFLVVILSIVYLMNTTQSNQKGYTLQQEQIHKDDLMLEKRALINKINEAKSLQRIETAPILGEMEKPEDPKYITE